MPQSFVIPDGWKVKVSATRYQAEPMELVFEYMDSQSQNIWQRFSEIVMIDDTRLLTFPEFSTPFGDRMIRVEGIVHVGSIGFTAPKSSNTHQNENKHLEISFYGNRDNIAANTTIFVDFTPGPTPKKKKPQTKAVKRPTKKPVAKKAARKR